MKYKIGLKFRMLYNLAIDTGLANLDFSGMPKITLRNLGVAYPHGYAILATMTGIDGENEAKQHAERLEKMLMLAGAAEGWGIDIKDGAKIEHDIAAAPRAEAIITAELHVDQNKLYATMAQYQQVAASINAWQRACASFINDSFFTAGVDSQFILRISAVEALCRKAEPSREILDAISELESHLEKIDISADARASVTKTLCDAKRKSVRSGYQAKFRSHGLDTELAEFDKLYGKRSKLVHEGLGRGQLSVANNDALRIARKLLNADINSVKS